jgi:endonuclease/exonuclease/phosphatase family metal-dependent hydrolase
MEFVTYNIRFSLGKNQQKDLRCITDAIKGADVIALQEVMRFWKRSKYYHLPE